MRLKLIYSMLIIFFFSTKNTSSATDSMALIVKENTSFKETNTYDQLINSYISIRINILNNIQVFTNSFNQTLTAKLKEELYKLQKPLLEDQAFFNFRDSVKNETEELVSRIITNQAKLFLSQIWLANQIFLKLKKEQQINIPFNIDSFLNLFFRAYFNTLKTDFLSIREWREVFQYGIMLVDKEISQININPTDKDSFHKKIRELIEFTKFWFKKIKDLSSPGKSYVLDKEQKSIYKDKKGEKIDFKIVLERIIAAEEMYGLDDNHENHNKLNSKIFINKNLPEEEKQLLTQIIEKLSNPNMIYLPRNTNRQKDNDRLKKINLLLATQIGSTAVGLTALVTALLMNKPASSAQGPIKNIINETVKEITNNTLPTCAVSAKAATFASECAIPSSISPLLVAGILVMGVASVSLPLIALKLKSQKLKHLATREGSL